LPERAALVVVERRVDHQLAPGLEPQCRPLVDEVGWLGQQRRGPVQLGGLAARTLDVERVAPTGEPGLAPRDVGDQGQHRLEASVGEGGIAPGGRTQRTREAQPNRVAVT
jgi:hypothetical protein